LNSTVLPVCTGLYVYSNQQQAKMTFIFSEQFVNFTEIFSVNGFYLLPGELIQTMLEIHSHSSY